MNGELSVKEQKKRSKEIDKLLRNEARKKKSEIVLLMLGPGRSGKSTFCKQMKILHLFGFTERERENFKWIVHTNTIDAILDLIGACRKFDLGLEDKNQEIADQIYDEYRVNKSARTQTVEMENMQVQTHPLSEEMGAQISRLWRDAAIREAYERRDEFLLSDSACYYLNSVERIADDKYVPHDLDILRARLATTSVVETTFAWEDQKFRLVDVGGQKGLRKKWLPLFTEVTAVIFCVATNEYDMMMEEEVTTNRMHDSLELWSSIVNNHHLRGVPMILFLNKKDLFKEKIEKVDLKTCFPEYRGGLNRKRASQFIEKKFKDAVANDRQGKVFFYWTQATDTNNIQLVWSAIKDIFMEEAIKQIMGGGI